MRRASWFRGGPASDALAHRRGSALLHAVAAGGLPDHRGAHSGREGHLGGEKLPGVVATERDPNSAAAGPGDRIAAAGLRAAAGHRHAAENLSHAGRRRRRGHSPVGERHRASGHRHGGQPPRPVDKPAERENSHALRQQLHGEHSGDLPHGRFPGRRAGHERVSGRPRHPDVRAAPHRALRQQRRVRQGVEQCGGRPANHQESGQLP
mmetsp:Transcript_46724/g.130089  ORF Transcript_46724/g.130089 Transcript_46724/m.130089 type:complete len:208 (-) Transcript_46724:2524-3147(-)